VVKSHWSKAHTNPKKGGISRRAFRGFAFDLSRADGAGLLVGVLIEAIPQPSLVAELEEGVTS
jgi:hypothetical protein